MKKSSNLGKRLPLPDNPLDITPSDSSDIKSPLNLSTSLESNTTVLPAEQFDISSAENTLSNHFNPELHSSPSNDFKMAFAASVEETSNLISTAVVNAMALTQNSLVEAHKLLADSINRQNAYKHITDLKYFSYSLDKDATPPTGGTVEYNVHSWLDSLENKFSSENITDDHDKCKLAAHFSLNSAKKMFTQCASDNDHVWATVKSTFLTLSLDAVQENDVIRTICNMKKSPNESYQSFYFRLRDLQSRLDSNSGYASALVPLMCDTFAEAVSLKFKNKLTNQDKQSLPNVLRLALVYRKENPDENLVTTSVNQISHDMCNMVINVPQQQQQQKHQQQQ